MNLADVAVGNLLVFDNYFKLFDLEAVIDIDKSILERKYFNLLSQYHPDKMIGKSNKEKINAMSMSITINKAFEVLKNKLLCVEHILQINNYAITDNIRPNANLVEELLEIREDVEENQNIQLHINNVTIKIENLWCQIEEYNQNKDWNKMQDSIISIKYYQKLLDDISK
jgi:molecular chaperone HscB